MARVEPESAIMGFAKFEAEEADDAIGIGGEAEGPVEGCSALHFGKSNVANVRERAARRVGPWDNIAEELNNLPPRKERLDLLGVVEREGAEQEPRGSAIGSCGIGRHRKDDSNGAGIWEWLYPTLGARDKSAPRIGHPGIICAARIGLTGSLRG